MSRLKKKNEMRQGRKERIRRKISGTALMPRLTVYKSGKHIYAQIVDDDQGASLTAASSLSKELRGQVKGANRKTARKVGELIAARALERKLTQVVFDRNGYLYHGVVKELAEGARAKGLKF